MPHIDYAFVADFAKVEPTGTLTVVGASWTFLEVPEFPAAHRITVAGRVKATMDDGAVPLRVTLQGPDNTFTLSADGTLMAHAHSRPYGPEQAVGHLFALDVQVPLVREGLYEVLVELPEHDERRRLAFEARRPDQA